MRRSSIEQSESENPERRPLRILLLSKDAACIAALRTLLDTVIRHTPFLVDQLQSPEHLHEIPVENGYDLTLLDSALSREECDHVLHGSGYSALGPIILIDDSSEISISLPERVVDVIERKAPNAHNLGRAIRYALDKRRLSFNLDYHRRFEQLLTTIATDFINLAPEEIDAGVLAALQKIGSYAGADRSFVFEYSKSGDSMTMNYEWHAEGIEAAALHYREIPSSIFMPIVSEGESGRARLFRSVLDLPRHARQLRDLLQFRKVKSVIFVPLAIRGEKIALLGFSSLQREKQWSDEVISLLEFVGQILVNALLRKRNDLEFDRQKEYLRQVIDMSPNLLFVRNARGEYVLANSAFARSIGRSIPDIVGKSDAALGIPAAESASRDRDDQEVLATMATKFLPEEPLTDLVSGETRWYRTVKYPLRSADGDEPQILTICTDLTERKRAEVALRTILEGTASATAENFFRSLVRHLATVLDTKYAFIAKVVPGSATNIQTLAVWRDGDYISNEEYDLRNTPTEELLKGKLQFYPDHAQKRFPLDHFLQQEHIHSYMGAPLINSDGTVLGILSVMDEKPMHDWPPGKWILRIFAARAAAELERLLVDEERSTLQKQLLQAQKMEAIGQLAAGVAHDLNNALGAVVGHLQLLNIAARLEPEWKNSVNVALRGCERASSLVEQLLGFSRQGKYNLQRLSPKNVVTETLDFLSRVVEKDIRIELQGESEQLLILADLGQLQQALTNIILNAAQAMPRGGVMKIRFQSREVKKPTQFNHKSRPGRYVFISISDSGIGIPESNLEKIFEPFFTTKEHARGSGLGLSMVYGIMQNHGGWIDVSSKLNVGSTFTLAFPQAENEALVTPPAIPAAVPRGSGTVMVIDDESMLVDLTSKFLERAGFTAVAYTSARAAVEWYRENHAQVDMIILDMKMPEMSGEMCFTAIREINPGARVVILSGYIQDAYAHKILGKGAIRFFQKPLKYPELMEWISEYLLGESDHTCPNSNPVAQKPRG